MNQFEYIREYYKVPAEIGREIIFEGKRKGVIAQDCGNYIGVNFHDSKPGHIEKLHPTWQVEYLQTFSKVRKKSAGSQRYDDYLSEDPGISFIDWLKSRSKKAAALLLPFLFILFSCEPLPESEDPDIEYDHKILHEKMNYSDRGNKIFAFAYTDGSDSYVQFGIYAKYEPGDTIYVSRYIWHDWNNTWSVVENQKKN